MLILSLAKGIATFIPGVESLMQYHKTGGTNSAEYSYRVWMKHLTLLWEHGPRAIPNTVAELGPGDSLGVGFSAMLSGANRYFALDVQKYANTEVNLRIFDELVEMFRRRAPGNSGGFPDYGKLLDAREFPSHILTDALLETAMAEPRLRRIRAAIANPEAATEGIEVRYFAPWSDAGLVVPGSVDLVLSHSVLEHVVDVPGTYAAIDQWLRPGGVQSHSIDFDAHNLASKWNGYRAYPEFFWRILVGKRKYTINREPCSTHVALQERFGYRMLCCLGRPRTDGIARSQLAPRWRGISDEDLACCQVFTQSRKPDRA